MKTVTLKQYTADAFTDRVFSGNPAAVCVLPAWPADPVMQAIAKENNLSETAFTVKADGGWALRWFTPGGEIDLCGHATLGTAFVLMHFYEKDAERIAFSTRSGALTVERRDSLYEMDFPAYDLAPVPVTDDMAAALGARPDAAYMGRDLLCVFSSAETVRALSPDMEALKGLPGLLAHATAPSDTPDYDCVSRSFAPKLSVPEDPVCGSGHCHIVPYWSGRLGKKAVTAYQASARGGVLYCRTEGARMKMAGNAALYAESLLHLPADMFEQE